ncbi:MAG: crossover junction endodeoxyribonuclease RuvC [Albidovulum sp.]|nr:crossover junction endodeoxyribonuclease RuvC [Albidovulum sp.]MDE0531568.1 crossover junction endodeoxyribonuclease RuvC [Albidovulum sp.]
MRVIGIDPGLRSTGWGVIESSSGTLSHLGNGQFSSQGDSLAERLVSLFRRLTTVVNEFRPEFAAVENTFVNKDSASALKLGQARAVALIVPSIAGLPVAEYAPNHVKKSVVGSGHAEKHQIEQVIKMHFPRAEIAGSDSADALAIALAHVLQLQYSVSLDEAIARAVA